MSLRGDRSGGGDDPRDARPSGAAVDRLGADLGGATIAAVVVAAIAIGLAAGGGSGAVVGPVGAVAAVAGASALTSRRLRSQAIGSCGLVAGLATVAVALGWSGSFVVPGTVVAVGAIGFALAPPADRRLAVAVRALRDSIVAGLVVGVAALLLWGSLREGAAVAAGSAAIEVLTATAFVGFLTLQLLALAARVAAPAAGTVVEWWVRADRVGADGDRSGDGDRRRPTVGSALRTQLRSVPDAVVYAIGAQLLALPYVTPVSSLVATTLAAMGPIGSVGTALLTAGPLHALALLAIGGASGVLLVHWLSPLPLAWLGAYPLRTLAFAAGGAVTTTGAIALHGLAPSRGVDTVSIAVAIAIVGSYAALGVLGPLAIDLVDRALDRRRIGLGAGAAALFVATALAARSGLAPVGVVAGVAASLLAWDLGATTLSMRSTVGDVDTREPELVHATGTVLVLAAGVALAAGALYVLGSVSPPSTRGLAVAPVVLSLLAVLSLIVALEWRSGGASVFEAVREAPGGRIWSRLVHPAALAAGGVLAVILVTDATNVPSGLVAFALVIGALVAIVAWAVRASRIDYG